MTPGMVGEERWGKVLQLQGSNSAWHKKKGSQRAPAAGKLQREEQSKKGKVVPAGIRVWARRKGQEGFPWCEGHRLVGEPPLLQCH